MSKVAINGQKIPLIPFAGIIAGLLAAVGFFMLPQSVLEAFVYQLRLDTMLPAAKPPLGFTARLLAAIGAGLATGLFTAFLAWKFAKPVQSRTRTASTRTRQFGHASDAQASAAPAIITAPPMPEAPKVETDEEKPKVAKKNRFRMRRKSKQDELDVAAMPMTRNRGLTGAMPRASVFDHDDQNLNNNSGNSLDISTATDSLQERYVDLPEWAYEENCDLSGVRSGITEPADENVSLYDAVPVVDETDDPFAIESFQPIAVTPTTTEAPGHIGAVQEIEHESDELVLPAWLAKPKAHDVDHDDGHSYDQRNDGVDRHDIENLIQPVTPAKAWEDAADWSDPVEAEEEQFSDDVHLPDATHQSVANEGVTTSIISDPVESNDVVDAVTTITPDVSVKDASIEELLARAEAGLKRRAAGRVAPQQMQIEVVPTTVASQPTVTLQSEPVAAPNPFAGFEHKEAEVDEALRAALSTLERMNRRSA